MILSYLAYYCLSGPWRGMWVRYGYNPQKDPSARQYQIIEYRIKSTAFDKIAVPGQKEGSEVIVPKKSMFTDNLLISMRKPEHMQKMDRRRTNILPMTQQTPDEADQQPARAQGNTS